jgi:tetraacyldisaccharide 4'-kinase
MSAQSWLNRIWYGRRTPPVWLVPASLLFAAIAHGRRALFQRKWLGTKRLSRPVIVVGNLSVGGTGKTPLVCWLVERLKAQGWSPGIVTRGYGGSERAPQLIDASADPHSFGDEPVMMARRTRVPVAVGRDRPAAAQLLVDAGRDVIISDDGMQHYALERDCEIIVVDGDRRFGNGWVLPGGPLREPITRLETVDAIVVNGGGGLLAGSLAMKVDGNEAVPVTGGAARPLSGFVGHAVHAVAGIGNPDRFFNMLRAHGVQVSGRALDDHVALTRQMIVFDDDSAVLMTEKDAVKCKDVADSRHWYVPVVAQFSAADENALMQIVCRRIARTL